LIKGVLEGIPAESFVVIAEEMQKLMHKKSGIYVLYHNNSLYYVGLAKNLRGRLKSHMRDHHTGKWNKFSVFLIEKVKYLKDIETLILRISKPKANRTKGRIPKHSALKKILQDAISDKSKEINQLKNAIR